MRRTHKDISPTRSARDPRQPKPAKKTVRCARQAAVEQLENRTLLSAGQLDPRFGTNGEVSLPNAPGTNYASVVQSDGKIVLVGGTTPSSGSASSFFVQRLNPDGSLDAGFGSGGTTTTAFPDSAVADAVLIQSDGKIIVGGVDEQPNTSTPSIEQFALARYNTNGTLDTSFGNGGTVVTSMPGLASIASMAFAPNGQIVAAGRATLPDPAHPDSGTYAVSAVVAARFTGVGALDTSFNAVGYVDEQTSDLVIEVHVGAVTSYPVGVAVQPDGKVILGSEFKIDPTLWRLNADGSLDTSFGLGGRTWIPMSYFDVPLDDFSSAAISQIIVQPGGKILVAAADDRSGQDQGWMLGQFNADGSVDTGFGDTSFAPGGGAVNVPLQNPGNSAGSRPRMAIESDGMIIIGGVTGASFGDYEAFRYSPSGVLDSTFSNPAYTPTAAPSATGTLSLTPANQVIIVTNSQSYPDPLATRVVRLQTDVPIAEHATNSSAAQSTSVGGSLNTSFGLAGRTVIDDPATVWLSASSERTVRATAVQADGKVLVAGSVGAVATGGIGEIYVERLNTDGSPDVTFGSGGIVLTAVGPVSYADAILVQPDGKILIGGASEDSATVTTSALFAMARYNADGSLDTSFGVGGILTTDFPGNQQIDALALYSNGDIVAAGSYFQYPDVGFDVARYNSSGALETSFNGHGTLAVNLGTATAHAYPVSLALQSDGKLLIGTHSGGQAAVLRYNQDGSVDTTFGTSGIALAPSSDTKQDQINGGSVLAVAVLPDGSISAVADDVTGTIAGGSQLVFKLSSSGHVDTTFGNGGAALIQPGYSYNLAAGRGQPDYYNTVGVIALSDGSLIVAGSQPQDDGDFNLIGQVPSLVHLSSGGQLDASFQNNVDPMLVPKPYYQGEVAKAAAAASDGSIYMVDEAFGEDSSNTAHWTGIVKYNGVAGATPANLPLPASTLSGGSTTPPTDTTPGGGSGGGGGTTPTSPGGPTVPTTPIGGSTPLPAGQLSAVVVSFSPMKAIGGARGMMVVKIRNAGATTFSGPITIDIYASTDAVATIDDTKLTTLAVANLTLKPGKSRNIRVSFNLATTLASGKYLLLANVTETSQGTAAYTAASKRAVTLTAAAVDLSIKFTPAKSLKLKSGKTAKAILLIRNVGNVTANGTFTINLSASADSTLSIGDQSLAKVSNARLKLAARASKRLVISFNPATSIGTSYDLIATLNSSTTPQDLNGANNSAAVAVTVL